MSGLRDPSRLSRAIYVDALRAYDVDGVVDIRGGDGRPLSCKTHDGDGALQRLVIALTVAHVEAARWRSCTGYFAEDGTLRHYDGTPCPLHKDVV